MQRFVAYADTPWNPIAKYIDNLSNGTGTLRGSLIEKALRDKTFRRPEAVEHLERARDEFRITLRYWRAANIRAAAHHLARAGTFWTHATWQEFLERNVIRTTQPQAYRPLPLKPRKA